MAGIWWYQSKCWIFELKYFWNISWTGAKVTGNSLVSFFNGTIVIQNEFKIYPLKYSTVSHKWPDCQTWEEDLLQRKPAKWWIILKTLYLLGAKSHRCECELDMNRYILLSKIHWEFICRQGLGVAPHLLNWRCVLQFWFLIHGNQHAGIHPAIDSEYKTISGPMEV